MDNQEQQPAEQVQPAQETEALVPSNDTAESIQTTEQVAPELPQSLVIHVTVDGKTPEDVFKEGYQQLLTATQRTISVEPKWIKRDDGTYSTVLDSTIIPLSVA